MLEEIKEKVKEEMPKTEVVAKTKRKQFSAAEKLRILREVDACQGSGEIGALLRREGIYSSYLTTWRRQRERGELDGLAPLGSRVLVANAAEVWELAGARIKTDKEDIKRLLRLLVGGIVLRQ